MKKRTVKQLEMMETVVRGYLQDAGNNPNTAYKLYQRVTAGMGGLKCIEGLQDFITIAEKVEKEK